MMCYLDKIDANLKKSINQGVWGFEGDFMC